MVRVPDGLLVILGVAGLALTLVLLQWWFALGLLVALVGALIIAYEAG